MHQSICRAPFKLMRASYNSDGRCELPILHTAGGLVGGDQLSVTVDCEKNSNSLLTSVAAQKIYGTIGRSKRCPEGQWARQQCNFRVDEHSDLEWMPQEVVVFANGLFEQKLHVDLFPSSSFLSAEVVRLGRTALGETLELGCWRSSLEICRQTPEGKCWEFVDRLELSRDALVSEHGMANQPVFGSFVWVAPKSFKTNEIDDLLLACRKDREGLRGFMTCSAINRGISARYLGPSTQAARFWFFRIWLRTRLLRGLATPDPLRVWPMQEQPLN